MQTKQYYTPEDIYEWQLVREPFNNHFVVEPYDATEPDIKITVEEMADMYPNSNRNEVIDEIMYGDSLGYILNYLNNV